MSTPAYVPGEPRVVVYAKPACHLCEVAELVVAEVCSETGERWRHVDISADDELMRAYGEQIPVTFVDGAQHDVWRVDAGRLRAALTG
ncbi:MAG: glutaredoxin family protein [Actinomycetota bacterium]|nr:glutaredoxin family protein [Actinomycetota bacterium]